jgi:serine/threonine-protein kinase RsbW
VASCAGEAVVELTIPSDPEFVCVARLAVRALGDRLPFSMEEIEDIRLAVGEACTAAIERAAELSDRESVVRIRCLIEATRLAVEVIDHASLNSQPVLAIPDSEVGEERQLGALLLELLMDDVQTTHNPETGANVVRMTKYITSAAR